MFYLRYLASELRRRRSRTVLTALGLAVGVALVVTVAALSRGLNDAQSKVLEPLTGVGTDMSVTRPIVVSGSGGETSFRAGGPAAGPPQLSAKEQRQLQRENGGTQLDFSKLGKPGSHFSTTRFMATNLSFPARELRKVEKLDGVSGATGSLTLNMIHLSGTVPSASSSTDSGATGFGAPPPSASGGSPSAQGGLGFEPVERHRRRRLPLGSR